MLSLLTSTLNDMGLIDCSSRGLFLKGKFPQEDISSTERFPKRATPQEDRVKSADNIKKGCGGQRKSLRY